MDRPWGHREWDMTEQLNAFTLKFFLPLLLTPRRETGFSILDFWETCCTIFPFFSVFPVLLLYWSQMFKYIPIVSSLSYQLELILKTKFWRFFKEYCFDFCFSLCGFHVDCIPQVAFVSLNRENHGFLL